MRQILSSITHPVVSNYLTTDTDTSRPFPKPKSGRIAVKVINHLGDEVMKVFEVR
jgi:adenine-specific DNA-methyltransferase